MVIKNRENCDESLRVLMGLSPYWPQLDKHYNYMVYSRHCPVSDTKTPH